MLTALHIKDFAIIDELELSLGPGFNVMTGETGAGKTIVVEAIKLILGERASSDAIRAGREKASVTAVFELNKISSNLRRALADAGIEPGEELIVHRTLSDGGRGKITANGVPITGGMLRALSEHLVDVSSQHEHQLLLDPARHASIVDAFGENGGLFESYRAAHAAWSLASRELSELVSNERAARERLDYLQFGLRELEAADLKPGEEGEIDAERNRLKHAVSLEEKSRLAEGALYGDAGSAMECVDRAAGLVAGCAEVDPEARPWKEALSRARAEIAEVARELARYAEKLESNPDRLEELEERLHLIRSLSRKHGGSVESCIARMGELKAEVDAVVRYDEVLAEKRAALEERAARRRAAAAGLSKARRKAAELLGRAVASELSGLGMRKVEFRASVDPTPEESWDESGPDCIEFLFSPNVGEPMRALARIASGGELSRVMLAVKSALSGRASLATTSVFDEVDSGIGGAVAEVVGRKLKDVARGRQVICITHLPQVAIHGDSHVLITKRVEAGRTVAALESLSDEGRVQEIARMLGGQKITETTLKHAREMLSSVKASN